GVLEVQAHRGTAAQPEARRVALEVMGTDRPGIVREASAVLARHGVSIDQVCTAAGEATKADGMMFEADDVLEVPAGVTAASLRAALESVAGELMVDIDLEDL